MTINNSFCYNTRCCYCRCFFTFCDKIAMVQNVPSDGVEGITLCGNIDLVLNVPINGVEGKFGNK
jgi:hypothetical protein